MLGALIKERRTQVGISLLDFANTVQQPVALVEAWEQEKQLPRKRDLDLVDRALGTNFSTTVYQDLHFSKRIGTKTSVLKIVLVAILLIGSDWWLTGFGYQPVYVFIFVLLLSTFVTFPVFFDESWEINSTNLTRYKYSERMIVKTAQIINQRLRPTELIEYSTIKEVVLKYKVKVRSSPVDFGPDYFDLVIDLGDSKIAIEIDHKLSAGLTDTMLYLSSRNLVVKDPQQIMMALASHQNLYTHFHPTIPRRV